MTNVKDAPKTATTIVIRSDINSKISLSKDPFSAIMRRVFQTEKTKTQTEKTRSQMEKTT